MIINFNKSNSFKFNFGVSVGLHVGILLLLIMSFPVTLLAPGKDSKVKVDLNKDQEAKNSPIEAKKIIEASIVDQTLVNNALNRQKHQEEARKQAALKEQHKLLEAKQKLEELKQDALKVQQESILAQKKIEEAKVTEKKLKESAEKAKKEELLAKKKVAEISKKSKEMADKKSAAEAAGRQRWLDREFERFVAQIRHDVFTNRAVISSAFSDDLVCEIQIQIMPDGSVAGVSVLKSSGNEAYDNNSKTAILKAAPFDMPEDQELNQRLRDIVLVFKQDDNNAQQ